MRSKLKLKLKGYPFALITFFILSAIVITFRGELNFGEGSNQVELYQLTKTGENELKTSTISGKISVSSNSGWINLKNAGKCTGLGTSSDPYVIENLEIDGGGSGSCILIENSDVYFKIENCTLYNSGASWGNGGIKMLNVDNGEIINNTVYNTHYGITLQNCINNDVIGNKLSNITVDGIHLSYSKYNLISENYLVTVPWGISLHSSEFNSISKNDIKLGSSIGIELYVSNNNNIFENTITGYSLGIYLNEESICNTVSNNVYNGNGQAIDDNQGMCPEVNFLPQIIGIIIGIICVTIIVGSFIIKRRYSNNEVRRFEKHAKREVEKKTLQKEREEQLKLKVLESKKAKEILRKEKEVLLPYPEEDLSTVEILEEKITRESKTEAIPPVPIPQKEEALESEEPTEILEEEKEVILPSPEEEQSVVELLEEEITDESQIETIAPVQIPKVVEKTVKVIREGPKGELISCPFCGKELSSDLVFCLRCGNKLKK